MQRGVAVVVEPLAVVADDDAVLVASGVVRLAEVVVAVFGRGTRGGPDKLPLHHKVFQAKPGVRNCSRGRGLSRGLYVC